MPEQKLNARKKIESSIKVHLIVVAVLSISKARRMSLSTIFLFFFNSKLHERLGLIFISAGKEHRHGDRFEKNVTGFQVKC